MDDEYLGTETIPKVDPKELRKLRKLSPWRSFIAIILDWLIIIGAILLCEYVSYWFYPISFIIIGSRFHGLEAMMHEATHGLIHPNKTLNEIVGELLVWPLGLSMLIYRKTRHFSHHRHIGTIKDAHIDQIYFREKTQFEIPKSRTSLFTTCLVYASRFPKDVWLKQIVLMTKLLAKFSRLRFYLWIVFHLLIVLTLIYGIIWNTKFVLIYLLFFVLPLAWIAVFSRYIRLLTEHFGIDGGHSKEVPGAMTRTVLVDWPLRVIFWPHNLNYHLEHHWYPSVPFYNLPKLHSILASEVSSRSKLYYTKGLRNLLNDLTTH